VWAQCRFLDPGVFSHDLDLFTRCFHNRYALGARKATMKLNVIRARVGKPPWRWPEEWLRGTIRTEEYLRRLAWVAIRVENAVLNLPPLTVERREFALNPVARGIYEQIKGGYGPEIASGRWPVMRTIFSILMRLQQITSGFLPDRTGQLVPVDHGKAECLRDILTEAGGEPVVVFSRFVHDLDQISQIAEQAGLEYAEISQRRKDGLSRLGTMAEGVQVLGIQEQAGAGIDLTAARIAVFWSLSWSLADYDQAVARIHRPPQSRGTMVYQLVARNTVDEDIYQALTARRDIINQVWEGLRLSA
jgi:SNF2 family DNA or RNA helicase